MRLIARPSPRVHRQTDKILNYFELESGPLKMAPLNTKPRW